MELPTLLDRCRQGDNLAWEAFVRLFETRGRWAEGEVFVPWMVRVARNVCLDHLRRKKARPPAEDIQADEMWDLASGDADPEAALEASGRRRLVWRALRSLGHLSREVIQLKEIQGLSLQEVAAILRVPVGTVKSRSNRARIELAEQVLALRGKQ